MAEKIRLKFWREDSDAVVFKSFMGEWLVGGPDEGLGADDPTPGVWWDPNVEWSVARTEKGNIAVYARHTDESHPPTLETYETFEQMRDSEQYPRNVLAETAAELGIDYEIELDI